MKNNKGFINIITIIGVVILTIVSSIGYFSYKENNLGATISQTQLTDTINIFRTNVNSSLTNINDALSNATSGNPGHYHTLSNDASATGTLPINKGGTNNSSSFNKGLVMASGTDAFSSLQTNGVGSIPIASGTAWVANTLTAGNNITITNAVGSISIAASSLFGGTGADGAFVATTTVFDLTSSSTKVFNFSSISITGTSTVSFSNPYASGTIIILKSKGDVTITCTSAPCIYATSTGATGGAGGAAQTTGSVGINGIANIIETTGGNGGIGAAGGVGAGATAVNSSLKYALNIVGKFIKVSVGAGGGGGGGGDGPGVSGGTGGRGGGGMIIEVGGALNFTTTNGITVAGSNGIDGTSSGSTGGGGGGGGGAGGVVAIIYNTLTANTGTIVTTAGSGGIGGSGINNPTDWGGGGGSGGTNRYVSIAGNNGSGPNGGNGGAGSSGDSYILVNEEF